MLGKRLYLATIGCQMDERDWGEGLEQLRARGGDIAEGWGGGCTIRMIFIA